MGGRGIGFWTPTENEDAENAYVESRRRLARGTGPHTLRRFLRLLLGVAVASGLGYLIVALAG